MQYLKFKNAIYVAAQPEFSLDTLLTELKQAKAQLDLALPMVGQPGVREMLVSTITLTQERLWATIQKLKAHLKQQQRDQETAARLEQERLDDEAGAGAAGETK